MRGEWSCCGVKSGNTKSLATSYFQSQFPWVQVGLTSCLGLLFNHLHLLSWARLSGGSFPDTSKILTGISMWRAGRKSCLWGSSRWQKREWGGRSRGTGFTMQTVANGTARLRNFGFSSEIFLIFQCQLNFLKTESTKPKPLQVLCDPMVLPVSPSSVNTALSPGFGAQ